MVMDHDNTSEEQNKLINENLNTADLGNVSGGLGEENTAGFKMNCRVCGEYSWCKKTGNYKEGFIFDDIEYRCGTCGQTFWK